MTIWHRIRFRSDESDTRPIVFPPPGPYWVTGYNDTYSTLVAWIPSEIRKSSKELLLEFWPEAYDLDITDSCDKPWFTSRFMKPEWWKE